MNASTIAIPSVDKRRQALGNQFNTWPRQTIARHFETACNKYWNRSYIYVDEEMVTYGAVWQEAVKYAKGLIALGVKRRDHIAILMENDPIVPSLYIAASLVGAVFIPINTMLQKDELAYIITQSDAKFLITHERIKKINYGAILSELWNDSDFQSKSQLEDIVCISSSEQAVHQQFTSWEAFYAKAQEIKDTTLKRRENQSNYPDEVATIMYTSGSTGDPKGVMLTHAMLLRSTYATCLSRAIEDGRITYAPLPFYHCFNIIEGILAMSFVGGTLIAPNLYTPLSALKMMERFKANDFLCVPSMFVPLLNQSNVTDFDLSALYAVWIGAAPAPVTVWEKAVKLFGLKEICTGYGQTEVASSGVITEMGDPIKRITQRVGRPKLGGSCGLPEYNNSVVQYGTKDVDTDEMLDDGAVGELVVRGNTVTHGYYKKPEETSRTIDKDGWLKTGDVGRIDENGYIEMLGRRKELYKVSGELVAPKEIESVINKHEAVVQAAVIGVDDAITTEAGAAFVELKKTKSLKSAEITKLCAERLARFKVPRHVWFIDSEDWPMTSTGKIQKTELQYIAGKRLKKG